MFKILSIDDTNPQIIRDLKLLTEALIRDNDKALAALRSQLVS
jgi:hypothetical protein